jgi:hypothetical protein
VTRSSKRRSVSSVTSEVVNERLVAKGWMRSLITNVLMARGRSKSFVANAVMRPKGYPEGSTNTRTSWGESLMMLILGRSGARGLGTPCEGVPAHAAVTATARVKPMARIVVISTSLGDGDLSAKTSC